MAALARQGVTATCSLAGGPRYGAIEIDSNLPDFRVCLGGPDVSPFAAAVLAARRPGPAAQLAGQLGATGTARVWVPAARSRADAFGDRADLRGPRDLPVLIVAGATGADLAAAVAAVTADLADAVIEVPAPAADAGAADATAAGGAATALAARSVALLNRGTPSSLVTPDGTATIALMRACSAWPSGVWIDGEPRTAPDGTSFSWQHWSHTFEYALAAGPATGARPASPWPGRTTMRRCWPWSRDGTTARCPRGPAWPRSTRPARCCPRSSRGATRSPPAAPAPARLTVSPSGCATPAAGRPGPGQPVHRPHRGPRHQPPGGR